MKKMIALLLSLFLLITNVLATAPAEIPVASPSCILMHPNGTVLYEKNADQKMAPASVTKIMTLLLIMEAIERGELSYDDLIIGSAHAASMGGSQIWLKEGESFTLHEMIKCIAVVSANDCCVAVAEHMSGSEEAFVAVMNSRAKELGMYNTNFVNCCGLEVEGHYTTARDIALMSAELIKHEKIFEYTTIWMDTIRDGAFGLSNTNKMIKTFKGMIGLKTGYTSTAGYCLSGVAERDGMRLIAVVMKADTPDARNTSVAALLNYGFANFSQTKIATDEPLMPVKVILGKSDCVSVKLASEEYMLIEKSKLAGLEKKIDLVESVRAPVMEGDELGSFSVYSEGELLLKASLTAGETVEKMTVFDIWAAILSGSFKR
ncbi:MAG: D-alanyl-D-alanine carboxypeptidase family protein [Clostridiaceae bacterium]|nr:D-alanyl-D-alanine carboxypeptidase family protein [Clostridiaceae bacterium]